MRVGFVAVGAVLIALVAAIPFLFFVLVPVGIVLLVLGFALPAPSTTQGTPPTIVWQRIAWVESAIMDLNLRLSRLEGRPRETAPPAPAGLPTEPIVAAPPATAAPPTPSAQGLPLSAAPAAAPAPVPPLGAPTPSAEVSRLEFELGEKWFQRIGIVVLAIAFAFVLAITLPRMTPEQVVGSVFIAAIALAILAEAIYRWKGLGTYAKGLASGAFGLAYIGAWGARFAFDLADLTGLGIAVTSAVLLNFGAAFRYRSPFLAVQAGLVTLAWVAWLRYVGDVGSLAASVLMALAALSVVFLLEVQRHILGATAVFVAHGTTVGISLAALAPWTAPALVSVVAVAWAIAARTRLPTQLTGRPEALWSSWGIALVLPLAVLGAAAGLGVRGLPVPPQTFDRVPSTDVVVLLLLGANLATWTWIELRAPENRAVVFYLLAATAALPLAGLLPLGVIAAGLVLAVYGTLSWRRPTPGLSWGANVAYAAVLLYQAARLSQPGVGTAYAAVAAFGATAVVHGFDQRRSGYGTGKVPTDLHLVGFALLLAALAALDLGSAIPSIAIFYGALGAAIALNRQSSSTPGRAAAVAFAGVVAIVAARWWALRPVLDPLRETDVARHLFAILGVIGTVAGSTWIARRRLAIVVPNLRPAVRIAPALAVLPFALLAQDAVTAPWFLAVPVVLAATALVLGDPAAFNLAVLLGIAQGFVVVTGITTPAEALSAITIGVAIWFAFGVALQEVPGRREMAGTTLVASTIAILVAAYLAYGLDLETTAAWTLAGFAAVAYGLWRRARAVRFVGFVAFFAVIGKALLYDIAGLALELRIVGLIIVAVSLLLISYGYARLRKRAAEPEVPAPPGPR